MHDIIVRLIRTYVPGAIAWLVGVLGLPESFSAELTVNVTALIFAAYYLVVAFLEQRVHPAFGWLLGVPKARTNGF